MKECIGLISHHGLKYKINTELYEKIKNNFNFLILLEQYIEGIEGFCSIATFVIALILIFNKVNSLYFFIIILSSYIILKFITTKMPIYKIPFLCFFSYYITDTFKFFINYLIILLLSIFYIKNLKILFIYIIAIILGNIISTFIFKIDTYTNTLPRNNNIIFYLEEKEKQNT